MNRRDFLTALGFGGGASALSACGVDDNRYYTPVEALLPYVTRPEQTTPGTNSHFATVIGTGPRAWPVVAVHRDGRVINVRANRLAPVPPAIPGTQLLDLQRHYSPDRIVAPRKGGQPIAWDAAIAELTGAVKAARSGGKLVAYLGPYRSGTLVQLLRGFADRAVFWEALGLEGEALAAKALFGPDAGLPRYNLHNATYILSFGAPFLSDAWGNAGVRASFANARDARSEGRVARFTLVSPHKDQTGSQCDEWLQCVPGTEALVAMGIAKALAETRAYQGPGRRIIDAVDLDVVASTSGVSKETVQHLASMLSSGGAVALPGGVSGAGAGATDLAAAVYVLNVIADQRDLFAGGGYRGPISSYGDLLDLTKALEAGDIGVLLLDDVDPVHATPDGARFAAAMAKAGLTVSLSSHANETNAAAALVLPTHDVFEDWGDEEPWAGFRLLRQPGTRPLYDTRSLGDLVLDAWRASDETAPPGSWRDFLQRHWRTRFFEAGEEPEEAAPAPVPAPAPEGEAGADGDGGREGRGGRRRGARGEGGDAPADAPAEPAPVAPVRGDAEFQRWWEEKLQAGFHQGRPGRRLELVGTDTKLAGASTHAGGGAYFLHVFPHQYVLDGRYANEPWAQETVDPMTGQTWDTWVLVHPETAAALGVKDNDLVALQTDAGTIEVGVEVHPCIRPDVIGVPLGGGHTAATGRYADGVGVNVVKLLSSTVDASGAFAWQQAKVAVTPSKKKAELTTLYGNDDDHFRNIAVVVDANEWATAKDEPVAEGSLTGIHHLQMDERLLAREKEWHDAHPDAEPEREEYTSFYPVPDHPTYRFAMTVDTNACNGCGACMIACATENNVPIVGKWKLKKRRQMGWIRLDRFFGPHTADGSQSVHFVPVMCQHCGHAPCESVCPVLATYHTIDGLNAMIYNRCVGTRYCSNACPYSARRFNYHSYEWPEPFNLQLNPDVSARTMGVMEKCTFCVQRIRATKVAYRAKGFTTTVPNDALEQLTACAEACPSQAITFGNLLDPESAPAKSRKSGRNYLLLEELNTYPAVNYLARASFNVQRAHHRADGAANHSGPAPHSPTDPAKAGGH